MGNEINGELPQGMSPQDAQRLQQQQPGHPAFRQGNINPNAPHVAPSIQPGQATNNNNISNHQHHLSPRQVQSQGHTHHQHQQQQQQQPRQQYKPNINSQTTYHDARAQIQASGRQQSMGQMSQLSQINHNMNGGGGQIVQQSNNDNYITRSSYENSRIQQQQQQYDPNSQFQRFHENMKQVNIHSQQSHSSQHISMSSVPSAPHNSQHISQQGHNGQNIQHIQQMQQNGMNVNHTNHTNHTGHSMQSIRSDYQQHQTSHNNNKNIGMSGHDDEKYDRNHSKNHGQKRSQKRNNWNVSHGSKHHHSSKSSHNKPQIYSKHGDGHISAANINNITQESQMTQNNVNISDEMQQMAKDEKTLQKRFDLNLTKLTQNDFKFLCCIGQGSFGKVYLVRRKYSEQEKEEIGRNAARQVWALKILNKRQLLKAKQIEHTRTERRVLGQLKHPFLVKMRWAFQTYESLYIVMEYANGGELFYHLKRDGKFDEYRAKFYAAEILLALQYMHSKKVIYRDLKPENVLLDREGHIKLTDFGLSKDNIFNYKGKTYTFCGTPEYLAPEVLLQKGHGRAVDWWSLGTLLYEMMHGIPPFYDENVHKMYEKILHAPLHLPKTMSTDARNIFISLLQRDPSKRLGSGPKDSCDIQNHPFFSSSFNTKWKDLIRKKISPPYIPNTSSAADTCMIDPTMIAQEKEPDNSSPVHITNSMQQAADAFKSWTWTESQQNAPLIACD